MRRVGSPPKCWMTVVPKEMHLDLRGRTGSPQSSLEVLQRSYYLAPILLLLLDGVRSERTIRLLFAPYDTLKCLCVSQREPETDER